MYTGNTDPVFLLSMPGGTEWIFIILAVVLLFGGKKIPELAKGLGKGMKDFKDAREGVNESADKTAAVEDKKELAG